MSQLVRYFKALADTNRLRILNLLLHGELCVCDLQYVLELSQPNVSRHLSYLKNSGLVLDRRDGYRVFYRLADSNQQARKNLFQFLKDAYKQDPLMQADRKRLKQAIATGACTLSESRSLAAVDNRTAQVSISRS